MPVDLRAFGLLCLEPSTKLLATDVKRDWRRQVVVYDIVNPIEELFLVMLIEVIEGRPLSPEIRRGIALDQVATGICEPWDTLANHKALATTRAVQFSGNNLSSLMPIIAGHSDIACTIRAGRVLK